MASAAVSTQERKLNSELKVKFQRLHETLAKENLLPVIDHLFAEGVISGEVEYKLRLMPNKIEQSRELLSILHTTHNPLAFVKVHEAMMAEKAYKHIIEQIDMLKVGMTEPISGTAISEHSLLPELNDYIRGIFPKIPHNELHQLTAHLQSLGVDEIGDLKRLKESHLTGHVKPIRMEKLLEAIAAEQMKESSQSRAVPQKQTYEQLQSAAAKPTSQISFPKKKDQVHDKRTTNNESKVKEYQQIVPRVVDTLPDAESIVGVTSLDDELYVLRQKDTEQVEVYNTRATQMEEEYRLVRRLSLPGVKYLREMTSCKQYRCLYISDNNCCVHRVELNGKVTKWSVNNKPHSLSVTSRFTVLSTSYEDSKLIELTTEGKQLREIKIQLNVVSLQHAIQLSNGQFVLCHGGYGDPDHRVCIVDTKGHVAQSYGDPPGSATVGELSGPRHLAVDKDGFIFVADWGSSRVLLLSPTLNFVREIVSIDQLKGENPQRLFLDVDRRRLYVAVEYRVVVVQL